jgi:hypothetical protein
MIVQVDEEFESQVRRNMQSLMKEPRQCIVDNILNYSVSRTNKEGLTLTHVPNSEPYWEGIVGIDNILNVLKVEYVKRLSFNGLPNVNNDRFRVSININF